MTSANHAGKGEGKRAANDGGGEHAPDDRQALLDELAAVRLRLAEADDTLRALRNGEVDAIVVGDKIYGLVGADESGHRMRAEVLSQMEDAVIATDLAGRVTYLNPAAERQYRCQASDVLGFTLDRLFEGQWLTHADQQACAEALQAGRAWRGGLMHLLPGGQRLALECTISCMLDEAGEHIGYLSVFRDVSARAEAEAALAESEALLQFSLDAARIGLWSFDTRTGRGQGSAHHGACFGYADTPADWSVEKFFSHVHSDDRAHVRETLEQAVRNGTESHFECRVVWADHGIHWIEVHGNAYVRAGNPDRMVGIIADITARKRAEAALREADRQKDEFLATLAHELRNPLAPIRTAAQVLVATDLAPEVHQKYVGMIGRQVAHMAHLLDDLLDIARITRGRMLLEKDYVDLREAIESGIEEVRPSIDAKRHTLVLEIAAEPIMIEADAVRIAQIVSNLVNNAAKYSNPGSTITVSAKAVAADACEVVVRDTGIGMSPEALRSVFAMFAQEEAAIGRSEGGLGIGLALVKGLVELHGGTIKASSPGVGKGSTFVVRLPTCKPVAAPAVEPSPGQAAGAAAPASILVADDNIDAGESVAMLLQMRGHQTTTATDGSSAFALAASVRPQIMLLDIGMPGMTGYEVARRVRQEAWGRKMFLIAATGWGQEEDRQKAMIAGFDAHLTKPFATEDLFALIEQFQRGQ